MQIDVPGIKDPDEYIIKYGAGRFKLLMENAISIVEYKVKVLKDECPFCDVKKEYVIEKSEYFTVLLARAPYVRDHILMVPNRHLVRLSEITPKER